MFLLFLICFIISPGTTSSRKIVICLYMGLIPKREIKMFCNIIAYIILILAVVLGTAANGFAKSANGFTLLIPSLLTAMTIVGCMFTLSIVMKNIPVGITYASFAGLCIVATTVVGIYKFNQMPDLYTIVGLILIIAGVLIVNLLGKTT